jgi:hypothetical protein
VDLAAEPPAEEAPPDDGFVAYIGCSSTRLDTVGYRRLGGRRLESWPSDGCSVEDFLDPVDPCWGAFAGSLVDREPVAGFFQVCILADEDTSYAEVVAVADTFASYLPEGAPIHVTGLPVFDPGDLCPLGGEVAPPLTRAYADDLAADGLAIRAPDLGPITPDLTSDGCHPNAAGQHVTGQQLLDWFGP